MMSSYDNWKTRSDRDEGSGCEPSQEADEAGDAEDLRQQRMSEEEYNSAVNEFLKL